MTFRVYNAGEDPADVLRIECINHPAFEGSRQSKAYLDGCLGCRAVYAMRKAREDVAPGRTVPPLRIELVEKPLRRYA